MRWRYCSRELAERRGFEMRTKMDHIWFLTQSMSRPVEPVIINVDLSLLMWCDEIGLKFVWSKVTFLHIQIFFWQILICVTQVGGQIRIFQKWKQSVTLHSREGRLTQHHYHGQNCDWKLKKIGYAFSSCHQGEKSQNSSISLKPLRTIIILPKAHWTQDFNPLAKN